MNFSSSEREESNYFALNTKRQLLKKDLLVQPTCWRSYTKRCSRNKKFRNNFHHFNLQDVKGSI